MSSDGPFSGLPAFVAWLARVFDELDLARANLAGHSMGALITAGMVAEHPSRLARVGLLCGVHRRTPEAAAAVRARAAALSHGERDWPVGAEERCKAADVILACEA